MILVNGAVAESVAATDRGLAYGDGVFRTLLSAGGRPRSWARHYRKLARDCAALAIPCPPDAVLAREIAEAAQAPAEKVVKIIVTRGSGARSYAPPDSPTPTRVVITGPAPQHPAEFATEGVTVRLCRTRLSSQPRLAGIKHLNRLEHVLARAEWTDPAIAEGILLDEAGNLVGGTMTNLFLVEQGVLVTPRLDRCGVAGVTRERVLEAAARHGTACREETIPQARLFEAEEAFLVNSVIGLWPIARCADRRWAPGACATRVRQWLDEED